ncbi:hypothetical protein EXIGLDRAFT_832407 [Exidia glandulosa HHB12029]|uniref:F-box domain-containing protein n=1 Tax=Exidia glandulosa HHB12029 TaxID=1314781 RepID=A0A165LPJ0_EXIGL|nr:hypothetical protein EXIGLDRAFT_832407 [Exidia glandulosa HHB12029]
MRSSMIPSDGSSESTTRISLNSKASRRRPQHVLPSSALTPELASSLQHVVRNITARAISSSPGLDFVRLRDEILAASYEAVVSCARDHNASLPINNLPAELLQRVAAFLPFHDRCSAVLVCSHWRAVLLSAPTIWKRIVLDMTYVAPERWSPTLLSLAQRSRQLPLSLELRYIPPDRVLDLSEYIAPMEAILFRVECLSLHAEGIGEGRWNAILCSPAPLLTTLRLVDAWVRPTFAPQETNLPHDLFSSHAPLLNYVLLDGLTLPEDGAAALATTSSLVQRRVYSMSGPDVHKLFRICPRLRSLTLLPTVYLPFAGTLQALRHTLEALHLGACYESSTLYSSATFASIPQRCLIFRGYDQIGERELSALLEREVAHSLRVEWGTVLSWADDEAQLAISLNGKLVAVDVYMSMLHYAAVSLRSCPAWTGMLVTLAVPSDIWYMCSPWSMPALRELDILVRTEHADLESSHSHSGDDRLTLRIMRIEAETSSSCSVTAQSILEFLYDTVAIESLEQLVLRGVEILDDGAKAELHGLATVTYEGVPLRAEVHEDPWYWIFDEDEALSV